MINLSKNAIWFTITILILVGLMFFLFARPAVNPGAPNQSEPEKESVEESTSSQTDANEEESPGEAVAVEALVSQSVTNTAETSASLTSTVTVAASNPDAEASSVLETLSTPITPTIYTYEVVATFPHDPKAFTQGLQFVDGDLYEGTGLRGQSSLRHVDLETGAVQQIFSLQQQFFGEGITVLDDKIYQLTWQSKIGFIYDLETFDVLETFNYPTEGWGMTHDGDRLIMSDGTPTIYFLDPITLEEVGQVSVYDSINGPIRNLNELEYIKGELYANVWQTDYIARIDLDSGQVTGWLDLRGLLPEEDRSEPVDVLNGIAYDAEEDRLFVTGKWWPKIFEIELRTAE